MVGFFSANLDDTTEELMQRDLEGAVVFAGFIKCNTQRKKLQAYQEGYREGRQLVESLQHDTVAQHPEEPT